MCIEGCCAGTSQLGMCALQASLIALCIQPVGGESGVWWGGVGEASRQLGISLVSNKSV